MADIKKVIVPKSSLPPVVSPQDSSASSRSISAILSTSVSGTNVLEITTIEDHGFVVDDIVNISKSIQSDFNIENAIVYSVVSSKKFRIIGSSSQTYTSGAKVAKAAGEYVVRFRIISEDRNRVSHWSPQYLVSPVPNSFAAAEDKNIKVTQAGNILIAQWNVSAKANEELSKTPSAASASYDVYVAWGSQSTGTGQLEYFGTVVGSSIVIPVEAGKASYRVLIQATAYPKKVVPAVAIADTGLAVLS